MSLPHSMAAWKAAAEDLAAQRDALKARCEQMQAEMARFLPIVERAEEHPVVWEVLTRGTGIATANGYRAALKGD